MDSISHVPETGHKFGCFCKRPQGILLCGRATYMRQYDYNESANWRQRDQLNMALNLTTRVVRVIVAPPHQLLQPIHKSLLLDARIICSTHSQLLPTGQTRHFNTNVKNSRILFEDDYIKDRQIKLLRDTHHHHHHHHHHCVLPKGRFFTASAMGGSPGELSEELVTQEKRKKGWRMNCDVGNSSVALPTSQFILQPFFRFSYVTSSSLNSPGEPPMARVLNLQRIIEEWTGNRV